MNPMNLATDFADVANDEYSDLPELLPRYDDDSDDSDDDDDDDEAFYDNHCAGYEEVNIWESGDYEEEDDPDMPNLRKV